MGRSSDEKRDFWQFVVSEQSQSGLSVREFCRREGVSEPSFYQWRKKLAASDEKSCEQAQAPGACSGFLPITVVDLGDEQVQAAVDVSSASQLDVQIVTPGGYQIQLSNTAETNLILRSLLAIERVAHFPEGATRC